MFHYLNLHYQKFHYFPYLIRFHSQIQFREAPLQMIQIHFPNHLLQVLRVLLQHGLPIRFLHCLHQGLLQQVLLRVLLPPPLLQAQVLQALLHLHPQVLRSRLHPQVLLPDQDHQQNNQLVRQKNQKNNLQKIRLLQKKYLEN